MLKILTKVLIREESVINFILIKRSPIISILGFRFKMIQRLRWQSEVLERI